MRKIKLISQARQGIGDRFDRLNKNPSTCISANGVVGMHAGFGDLLEQSDSKLLKINKGLRDIEARS